MKKLLLFSLLVLGMASTAFAQLPEGAFAPNFTAVDIEGNEHDLYEVLDQGKSVILDVSATWCPPCWSYHQSGILEEVYEEFGPDGTDEIMVFFIEGDASTGMDDLMGNTGGTMGDWITGTPYPIIDNRFIASTLYEISYYPTLYMICPNRYVSEIGQQGLADAFHNFHNSCPKLEGTNNASIYSFEHYEGPTCGNIRYEPEMLLQNMGSETMTSAEIEISLNGTVVETTDWTGELTPYAAETITLPNVLNGESFDMNVNIITVNGEMDADPLDNSVDTSLDLPQIADNKGQLIINTDNYGDETYWVIFSPQGQIVAEGGNPNVGLGNTDKQTRGAPYSELSYGNNEEIITDIELPAEGCHFFFISDYYGDGICCNEGSGSYKLLDSNGNTIFEGNEYGAALNFQFDRQFFSDVEDEVLNTGVNIIPNPSDGNFRVIMDLQNDEAIQMTIQNTQGMLIKTLNSQNYTAGLNNIDVNLEGMANGVYFLNISTDKGVFSEKIVISH